ncbi:MAG: WhiB family transcriptional regulator [Candidatus Saccharimonadales bacterium]
MSGDWRDDAACLGTDPEVFFPEGAKREAALQAEMAKRICKSCVVVETCLKWALETGQDSGVWGGHTQDERRALKRRSARVRRNYGIV